MFSYNPTHRVVICHLCQSCIIPGQASQERHLRAKPHQLLGDVLKSTMKLLSSYDLSSVQELQLGKPRPEEQCELVEHLASYSGFHCRQEGCSYCTRHNRKIKEHVASQHSLKAVEHKKSPLWNECILQTYFTGPGRIDYFVVKDRVDNAKNFGTGHTAEALTLTKAEKDLFVKLEKDYEDVKVDLKEQARIVHDIGDSRSEQVPWLHDLTGFLYHMPNLKDEEI